MSNHHRETLERIVRFIDAVAPSKRSAVLASIRNEAVAALKTRSPPGNWRVYAPDDSGEYVVQVELPASDSQLWWFNVATFHDADMEEDVSEVKPIGRLSAYEYVHLLLSDLIEK